MVLHVSGAGIVRGVIEDYMGGQGSEGRLGTLIQTWIEV